MAGEIFRGTIGRTLQKTLDSVIADKTDNLQGKARFNKWCEVESMDGAYADHLETADSGLAAEKPEGTTLALGGIREGVLYRFLARTFGRMVPITEEALEDGKYKEAIDLAARNKRAMWKTAEVDATSMLVRGFSTSYPAADGQPAFSASHPLPYGGLFSNLMAVPMSPSPVAFTTAQATIASMVGHDGQIEGYGIEAIISPQVQYNTWWGIVNSQMTPVSGNFAEVNVVNKLYKPDIISTPFWSNTDTNYAFKTDVPGGFTFKWRRKMRGNTWVENGQEVMLHAISARWAIGWYDPRGFYGVQA